MTLSAWFVSNFVGVMTKKMIFWDILGTKIKMEQKWMSYESVVDMNEIFFSVFRFVNQGKSLCDSDAYSVVQGNKGILSLSQ